MKKRLKNNLQSGFLSVEAIAVTFVFVTFVALGSLLWSQAMGNLSQRSVAQQLNMVAKASQQYANAKGLAFFDQGSTVEITTKILSDEGILAPIQGDGILKNAWQQNYKIFIHRTTAVVTSTPPTAPTTEKPSKLVIVILLTGGNTSQVDGVAASVMAGAGSGIIITKESISRGIMRAGTTNYFLRGMANSYEIPLGVPLMNIPVAPNDVGNVGYYVSLDDAALSSDTIFRVAVAGKPELNQMNVDLDMRDHSLTSVGGIQFNPSKVLKEDLNNICKNVSTFSEDSLDFADYSGEGSRTSSNTTDGKVFYYTDKTPSSPKKPNNSGLYTCREGKPLLLNDSGNSAFVRNVSIVASGTVIPKPTCPIDQHPFINVSLATLPQGLAVGQTVLSSYTDNGRSAGTWTVHLSIIDSAGSVPVTRGHGGELSVITSCSNISTP